MRRNGLERSHPLEHQRYLDSSHTLLLCKIIDIVMPDCRIAIVVMVHLAALHLVKGNRAVVKRILDTCAEAPGRLEEPVETDSPA